MGYRVSNCIFATYQNSSSGNGGTINVTTLSGTSVGDITISNSTAPLVGLELDASVYGATGKWWHGEYIVRQ